MPEPPLEALSRRPDHALPRMREPRPDVQYSSLNRNDILFALFKHKWKILFCAVAGLVAAATVYFFYPPVYESQAKLLVRAGKIRVNGAVEERPGHKLHAGDRVQDAAGQEWVVS